MASHTSQRPAPLTACPIPPKSLAFPTYWYRIPDVDNFWICTKCYEDKLRSTRFASLLRCDYLDLGPGSVATCDFNTPRIDSFLRQAVASNNFQPLYEFAKHRSSVQSCSGIQGIKGGNGVKWFKPVQDDIPGFVCCEACYEDDVLGSNFMPQFIPYLEQQPTDQVWSCDLAIPYLKRSLQGYARSSDWHGFVQAGRHRMSLPTCVGGESALASSKRWYNTKWPSPIRDMTVCEACFLDRVGCHESMAQNFAQVAFSPLDMQSRMICDFRLAPMAACADTLLAHDTFEKWHYFVGLTMSKPTCNQEGIIDGEWYGLPHKTDASRNIENFDICGACHAGWNQSADWGNLFRRLEYPPGTSRVCDLHPLGPRYSEYAVKWNQMYLTRDPAPFIDYVSRLASLPTCQGTRRLENANWYGDENASLLICPSCFEQAVRGTHFASAFLLQATPLPGGQHCSLYSLRMRERYAEACKQKSMDSLLSFASQREQIYQQTIPHIEWFMTHQQQKQKLLSIAGKTRANAVQAASLGNAFTGGNAIVSNFDPKVVLYTLNYEQQRRNLQYDPQKPKMMQLERMWKEVE